MVVHWLITVSASSSWMRLFLTELFLRQFCHSWQLGWWGRGEGTRHLRQIHLLNKEELAM